MSKYEGDKGFLYELIVKFLREYSARELLEMIIDALKEVNGE